MTRGTVLTIKNGSLSMYAEDTGYTKVFGLRQGVER